MCTLFLERLTVIHGKSWLSSDPPSGGPPGLVEAPCHSTLLFADSGVPDQAMCVVTTAAIDIHRPNVSSDLFSVDMPLKLRSQGAWVSSASESASCSMGSSITGSNSSQTLCSARACSMARNLSSEPSPSPLPLSPPPQQHLTETTVQDLLSSLSEDPCPSQGTWDPAPFAQPSPVGSTQTSPELEHSVSLLNRKNQEGFPGLQLKPALHFQAAAPALHRFSSLESKEQTLHRVPEA